MKRRKIIRHSAAYLALGVLIIIALFPYFWMITCAIRDQSEIFISPPKLWSSNVSLDSFERILTETKLPRYMLNSLITSLMATAMCIFCAIPAGYALARFQFKGKNTVTTGILLVKLLPQTATLIPLYIMLVNVRLINNSFGLAFTHLFIMVPYTIWMSRGFIKTIPFTVEEAALIDGCNKIQAIVKVVLPMISSGLFAVGLYAFMLSWEEFLFAYTFTGSEASKTITVGLSTLIGEDTSDWGGIMAASIMMGLPVLIFFFSVQDTFIKGIVGGAVKG
jgi:multiple sugar transport system permease protein